MSLIAEFGGTTAISDAERADQAADDVLAWVRTQLPDWRELEDGPLYSFVLAHARPALVEPRTGREVFSDPGDGSVVPAWFVQIPGTLAGRVANAKPMLA